MSSPVSNDHIKNDRSEKHMDSPEHSEMLQNAVHDWMTSAKPEASGSSAEHSPQAAHILGDFKLTDGSASKESEESKEFKESSADASPKEAGASAGKEVDSNKELEQLAKPEGYGKEMLATPEGKRDDKENDQITPSQPEKENRDGKLGAASDQHKSEEHGSEKVESKEDSATRKLAHGESDAPEATAQPKEEAASDASRQSTPTMWHVDGVAKIVYDPTGKN